MCFWLASLALSPVAHAQAWGQAHEQAVQTWRAGDAKQALAQLRALHQQFPDARAIRYDLIVVAHGAGATREALTAADGLSLDTLPEYVLRALARAARDENEFARSRLTYDELLRREPKQFDAMIGLALALRGERRFAQAEAILAEISERDISAASALSLAEAKGLVAESLGNWTQALRLSDAMLQLDAQNRSATMLKFRALRGLGLHQLAMESLPKEMLTQEEQIALEHAVIVADSRYVLENETPTGYRFRLDVAIDALRALLDRAPATQQLSIKMDLVALLHERQQEGDALTALAQIIASGAQLPGWFVAVAARIYLANRQPERAIDLIHTAIKAGADERSLKIDHFFALLEAERHADALALADSLLTDVRASSPAASPTEIMRARLLRVRALLYTDHIEHAAAALTEILESSPANRDARLLRVEIDLAKGNARQADATLRVLLGEADADSAAMLKLADATFQRGDRAQARYWLETARLIDPYSGAGTRTARDRASNDAPSISLNAFVGRSSADSTAPIASREHRFDMTVFSPWFDDQFRLHAGYSETGEIKSLQSLQPRRSAILGAEWSAQDWSLLARVTQDNSGLTGAHVRATASIGDAFKFNIGLGRDGDSLPLRAWRVGTHATALQAGISLHADWYFVAALNAEHIDFNDDNHRNELSFYASRRIVSEPVFKLDARVDAYGLWNSRNDVAYYSPLRQHGVSLTVLGEWLQWRHYERSYSHHFSLAIGSDWQQGYGQSSLIAARYQQAWQLDRCTRLRYSLEWMRRSYDGQPESRLGASLFVERKWM